MAASRAGASRTSNWLRGAVATICSRRFATVSAVLVLFLAVVGIVNYGRWGNPLVFADYHTNKWMLERSPGAIPRLERYGEFNLARLPWGMQYYFVPLWVVPQPDGTHLFEASRHEMMEGIELPPGSLLLSDPLVFVLVVAFACLAVKARRPLAIDLPYSLAAIAGLSVSGILMLMAISMQHRYRMEFYPPLDMAALLGLALILQNGTLKRSPGLKLLLVAAVVLGIVCAHLSLVLYKTAPVGDVGDLDASKGWLALYVRRAMTRYPSLGWLIAGWTN